MISKILGRRFGSVVPHATKLLINGKWVNAASGKTFDTFNPATEAKICSIAAAGEEDVNRAVAAARNAFDNGPWRRMPAVERGKLMYKLADLIEKHGEELATLESMDNGKPVNISRGVDLALAVKVYRYYAGWADKITGDVMPNFGPYFAYTRQEPVGVCAQIIPWNFPMVMQAWKLGPLLACGAVSVMKPAEQTPLTALRIGELIMEAGFPEGVVNLLPGLGEEAGRPLAQHKDVDKVAFTGSTEVGLEIMRNSHKHNLKRVTLELGGKSANIIFDDAPIEKAIAQS